VKEDVRDYIRYRLSRAEESLQEAEMLAASGHWNTCVNRLYYACFYAVSAMLLKKGISSSKHSGIRTLFNREIVKPGAVSKENARIYNFLFERRREGDYEDLVAFSEAEVLPWINDAKTFVDVLKSLLDNK
jgi:uncharacterized protein (UPF0332 family)